MGSRIVSGIMVAFLLVGMLTLAFNIEPVKAEETIYIQPDGSVDPPTAPIQRDGNMYTFTGDIKNGSLIVEKDNVVIDGAGHTIQGTNMPGSNGIYLYYISHVTIKNVTILLYEYGVLLESSSNNIMVGNNITNNLSGIRLTSSSSNIMVGNSISGNSETKSLSGIWLLFSSNNIMVGNNITNNLSGVHLQSSSSNNISGNKMTNNTEGVYLRSSSNYNDIYHNNIVDKIDQAYSEDSLNIWDYGYPSGGNYWSEYNGTDGNGDGIGDTTYVIDADNQDRYPLMHPWSSLPVHNINTGLGYIAIQEAINASETLAGHTVFVEAGTYYENVVVNKTVSFIGENKETTIIDCNDTGIGFHVLADNVTITRFTIKNGYWVGIHIDHANNTIIYDNILLENYDGIYLGFSNNNTIVGNNVTGTLYLSVYLYESQGNRIVANTISNAQNSFYMTTGAVNNTIYHNNINGGQAISTEANTWDDGYPSGGNYWNDYNGTDYHSGLQQNETGSDGIGDTAYVINEDNQDGYPLTNRWIPPDIAIVDVKLSKTIVGQGFVLNINVAVENQGNKIEAINVTVYANATIIASNMTLTNGNITITFPWNACDCAKGNYTILAYVWPVPNETDTTDNTLYSDLEVCVTIPGDVDADFGVDLYDAVKLLKCYGAKEGSPSYDANCDIDGDGDIDLYDAVRLLTHYGQKYP